MFEKKLSFGKQIGKVILAVSALCILSFYNSNAKPTKGNILMDNSSVVINELMAKNETYITDQEGKYEDWIELYNNSAEPLDISGYYLSDKADRPDKFQIPEGTIIQGNGYLIIWADEDGDQEGIHANFKLSADGEELRMYKTDMSMIQEVIFGPQEADMSYSRIPNGTGDFIIKEPTFGENNEGHSNVEDSNDPENTISLYPNPAIDHIFISSSMLSSNVIEILDSNGSFMQKGAFEGELLLDLVNYPPGVYFVKIGEVTNKFMIHK
jgi:hypothetical protein